MADLDIESYPNSLSTITILSSQGKTLGLSFTQGTNYDCDGHVNYTMTTNVYCDKTITSIGSPVIKNARLNNDGCGMTVNLTHAAGCSTNEPPDPDP